MAVVVGTVQEAFDFTEAQGPGAATVKVMNCKVNVIWPTGTYAQADDANFVPATVIQDERRNGKTVTILSANFAGAGDENGTVIGAGACAVSTGTITCPLTQADLTTERANGAMSGASLWNKPITFNVTFTESK
jgi:hypothetical protein